MFPAFKGENGTAVAQMPSWYSSEHPGQLNRLNCVCDPNEGKLQGGLLTSQEWMGFHIKGHTGQALSKTHHQSHCKILPSSNGFQPQGVWIPSLILFSWVKLPIQNKDSLTSNQPWARHMLGRSLENRFILFLSDREHLWVMIFNGYIFFPWTLDLLQVFLISSSE